MRIGKLSQTTGVEIETIRFYEKEGLLQPAEREANGYRRYRTGAPGAPGFHPPLSSAGHAATRCETDIAVHDQT